MRQQKVKAQKTLGFPVVKAPKEFTWETILEAVARHIACDDQVSFEVRL